MLSLGVSAESVTLRHNKNHEAQVDFTTGCGYLIERCALEEVGYWAL